MINKITVHFDDGSDSIDIGISDMAELNIDTIFTDVLDEFGMSNKLPIGRVIRFLSAPDFVFTDLNELFRRDTANYTNQNYDQ